MPPFSYRAADPAGRIISGVMEAPDASAVAERLRRDNFFPVAVSPEEKRRSIADLLPKRQVRMHPRELLEFTRQMSTLLRSGLELDRCLVIMRDLMENPKSRQIVMDVQSAVHGGETLSQALARQQGAFPAIYLNMVRAGETGGFLEKVFDRLAAFLETRLRLVESVRSALIYPAVLAAAGAGAIAILMVYVIPKFAKIFEGMGGELPATTQALISLSAFVSSWWWLLLAAAATAGLGLRAYVGTPGGKMWWDTLSLRLPVFGPLLKKSILAQFTRTLGTLLQSGVPITQSLLIVKDTVSNGVFTALLERTAKGVKEGRRMSAQLGESGLFPPLATHMTLVGEESGTLDEMMMKLAAIYDEEVETAVKRAITLLEPAMILVMGTVVAFVVVSMLTAIFSVNDLPM